MCIYSTYEGECTLWEDGNGPIGCSKDGYCVVDGDPNPDNSCCSYESSYMCYECGADLNIEECNCE